MLAMIASGFPAAGRGACDTALERLSASSESSPAAAESSAAELFLFSPALAFELFGFLGPAGEFELPGALARFFDVTAAGVRALDEAGRELSSSSSS